MSTISKVIENVLFSLFISDDEYLYTTSGFNVSTKVDNVAVSGFIVLPLISLAAVGLIFTCKVPLYSL